MSATTEEDEVSLRDCNGNKKEAWERATKMCHVKETHETLGLGRTTKTLGFNNGLKTLALEVMLKTQALKSH